MRISLKKRHILNQLENLLSAETVPHTHCMFICVKTCAGPLQKSQVQGSPLFSLYLYCIGGPWDFYLKTKRWAKRLNGL